MNEIEEVRYLSAHGVPKISTDRDGCKIGSGILFPNRGDIQAPYPTPVKATTAGPPLHQPSPFATAERDVLLPAPGVPLGATQPTMDQSPNGVMTQSSPPQARKLLA